MFHRVTPFGYSVKPACGYQTSKRAPRQWKKRSGRNGGRILTLPPPPVGKRWRPERCVYAAEAAKVLEVRLSQLARMLPRKRSVPGTGRTVEMRPRSTHPAAHKDEIHDEHNGQHISEPAD